MSHVADTVGLLISHFQLFFKSVKSFKYEISAPDKFWCKTIMTSCILSFYSLSLDSSAALWGSRYEAHVKCRCKHKCVEEEVGGVCELQKLDYFSVSAGCKHACLHTKTLHTDRQEAGEEGTTGIRWDSVRRKLCMTVWSHGELQCKCWCFFRGRRFLQQHERQSWSSALKMEVTPLHVFTKWKCGIDCSRGKRKVHRVFFSFFWPSIFLFTCCIDSDMCMVNTVKDRNKGGKRERRGRRGRWEQREKEKLRSCSSEALNIFPYCLLPVPFSSLLSCESTASPPPPPPPSSSSPPPRRADEPGDSCALRL